MSSSSGRRSCNRLVNFTCASQAIPSATSEALARLVTAVHIRSLQSEAAIPFLWVQRGKKPGLWVNAKTRQASHSPAGSYRRDTLLDRSGAP